MLNDCDVLLLQEIILLNEDKDTFYSIDSNLDFHVFPSRLSISNNFDGLPAGGLDIMWRKSLGVKVNVVNCSIHYMIIDISIGEWTLGVVNIYMPHDNRSAGMLGDYNRILGELQASLETM